jgi:hypothetical protein
MTEAELQQAQADHDRDVQLQEQFAAALDKLVGDFAERGLTVRSAWVELSNAAESYKYES